MSKVFELAAKASEQEVIEPFEFTLEADPDTPLRIFPPKPAQMALLTAATSSNAEENETVGTFITTFFSMLDHDSARRLRARMFDREDPFDVEDLVKIMTWAAQEAAARPTQSSPDSSPSRTTNGQRSGASARRRASTRSRSASTSSATSSTPGSSNARVIEASSTPS
jgi:hypothetical protein